jgi:hypothetical protein
MPGKKEKWDEIFLKHENRIKTLLKMKSNDGDGYVYPAPFRVLQP